MDNYLMNRLPRNFGFVNNFNDFFKDFVYAESNSPLNLEVNVAGIAAKDISVNIEGSNLIIKGETNGRKIQEVHSVPRNIDAEKIEVTYEHGLLFVKAPTVEKKIGIKVQNTEK